MAPLFKMRSLFFGVYASSRVINVLFLPLCYSLLFTPFTLLLVRRYHLHRALVERIPEHWTAPDILPQLFISLIAVCLVTRVLSGRNSSNVGGRQRRIQLIPYWVPWLRHWGNMIWGGDGWLKSTRDTSITNIFTYSLAGRKHNVILSDTLLTEALKNPEALAEAETQSWTIPKNAFGLSGGQKQKYQQLRPAISAKLQSELLSGGQLKETISASLKILKDSLPDLISFNSSIVDQMPWERVSDVELTDGTEEAESELYALVNEYFCNIIIPPIIGPQFAESYDLLATDLATITKSFYALALGFPRWVPIPGLPTAKFARKRLLNNLTGYFRKITNPEAQRPAQEDAESGSELETDAETPTPLSALNELFTKNDLPMQARAAITLEILHSVVSEAVPLVFWSILHIYSASSTPEHDSKLDDSELDPLGRIIKETRQWACASQPPSFHPSFPSPPQIVFSGSAPLSQESEFPYLRSCIEETRRLYSTPIVTARLIKPITITEPSTTDSPLPGQLPPTSYTLDKSSYLDIGLSTSLINTAPANYLDPLDFKHGRFESSITSPTPAAITLKASSQFSPFPFQALTTPLVLAFLAGAVQLWDLGPAPRRSWFEEMRKAAREAQEQAEGRRRKAHQGGEKREGVEEIAEWKIPGSVDGAGWKIPSGGVRVRFRRRAGLVEERRVVR